MVIFPLTIIYSFAKSLSSPMRPCPGHLLHTYLVVSENINPCTSVMNGGIWTLVRLCLGTCHTRDDHQCRQNWGFHFDRMLYLTLHIPFCTFHAWKFLAVALQWWDQLFWTQTRDYFPMIAEHQTTPCKQTKAKGNWGSSPVFKVFLITFVLEFLFRIIIPVPGTAHIKYHL